MASIKLEGITTIVLDIEGTLCPIWFVSQVLYPYATENLESIVRSQWNNQEFAVYKAAFPEELQDSPDAVINHCLQLASKDIKDPAWKKLQGLIWRQGYADGVLSVPLFRDVVEVLNRWKSQHFKLVIFSSGSVEAQKLFFGYVDTNVDILSEQSRTESHASVAKSRSVETEDLNPLFEANFDTITAGPKVVASSYERITNELIAPVERCLFLSDNVKEIAAAKEAGLHAVVVERPGNAPLSENDRQRNKVITSLDDIELTLGV